ncbi:tRNA (adenine(22)-N(1))-methyltransferase TrmK [Shouchella sp. 1P09AA]|uniref:tRNA (adenine(22)-N(1))-methyltransferase n=1 Tax=unclassified Shouchella TaxID=2893065 RepID=UPI0039A1F109
MNTNQLSRRLERVAHYAKGYQTLADIGSDHAYLPCYLCLRDPGLHAIAGEINEGPYQSARKQVQLSNLEEQIEVRKGSGLDVINVDEHVDVITVAGMGGPLIASILELGLEKLTSSKRLVLQPNVASQAVREWLMSHQFSILAEEIIEEDDKIYEIVVAEKSHSLVTYTEVELLMGPLLIQNQTEVFKKKWTQEKNSWERVLKQLKQGTETIELANKKEALKRKIDMVEEVFV